MRTELIALLAVAVCGCPSTSVYRTADPVDPGRWQVSGAAALGGLADTEQDTRLPTGQIELGARRGITEDLDLGAKLYTVGVEASATWRFYRGRTWSWAAIPSISGARTQRTGVTVDAIHLFANAGAVASRPLSRRWTLGLGGFAGGGVYWPETGGSARGGWLGGFAHADVMLDERWHLTPELGGYRVVAGQVPVRGGAIHVGAAFRRDL